MSTLQKEHDKRRAIYMNSCESRESMSRAHHEFYTWLADAIGITVSSLPCTLDEVRASTDSHLNDIPLDRWDGRDYIVRAMAHKAGMRSWSLSDTVCCLKAFARREVTNG